MRNTKAREATQTEALLLVLWGIRHQLKEIDRLLHQLIDELSDDDAQDAHQ